MSKKNLIDEKVDSDDEEDDDNYCPIKNDKEQSDASDESEHDDDDDVNEATGNEQNEKQNDLNVTPYDESKTNELWKSFTSNTKAPSSSTTKDNAKVATDSQKATTGTASKIFEFAGEKIAVPVTTIATTPTENVSLKRPASSNSVLDRLGIGKKQKLSTLEKSRLDWSVHKQSESLVEDLDSHRRGKDSYVEKKAFLQRSEEREHDHFLNIVKKK